MNWTRIADAMPQDDHRVLIWMGHAIFGSHSPSQSWSFDFIQGDLCVSRISHFCEVMGPAGCSMWTPISEFHCPLHEDVILWCDGAVVAYRSDDAADPERDAEGWVIDYRFKGIGKPTHARRITPP